ncbi:Hypothetical predicted protein [Octopus vulgaris]|uniref:LysM domain-containing protein n=1 Tax=Octopus vulgaris TaxID=6645 RepID=A0AA36BYA0_OCTVU|nr:Hypothetical predicted protein [Octopus vulgaris]
MELNLRRKSHPMSALEVTPGCAASSKQYFKHLVSPHDSIIAISLKYDVSVEQLKRENKLWSNDALVLREFLLVPVTKENSKCVPAGSEIVRAATLKSDTDSVRTASNNSSNGPCEDCDSERVSSTSAPDLSAKDFLNKYDSSIAQLKSNVQRMEESTDLGKHQCISQEGQEPGNHDDEEEGEEDEEEMSGDAFMNTLRNLQCPKVEKLSAQFFDRHFANQEATRSFITWFCKTLNSKHVVAPTEMQRFDQLVDSGAKILEGSKLSEALADVKKKKELLLSKEKLLDEELELCLKRKDNLLQSKIPMEQQNSVIRARITKTHVLIEKAQDDYTKAEQTCYEDAHMMNKSVLELVKTVQAISDQLQPSKDRSQLHYFSHLQLGDYYDVEEKFSSEIDGFFRKQFMQLEKFSFSSDKDNIKSRFDLLGIPRPEISLIRGPSENMTDTINKEIQRICNIYPNSERSLITAKINHEYTTASKRALEVKLTALRERKINWIYQAKLKEDAKKLRSSSSIVNLFKNDLLPLIQQNRLRQENKILDCYYGLKLARKEHYLDQLNQVLEQVLLQKARYEFVSTCCQVENENQLNLHHLLTSVYMALSTMKSQSKSRQALLDNYTMANVEAKNALSYKNKFLKNLKTILTSATISDDTDNAADLLYIDNARMKGVAESLHATANKVIDDLQKLEQQREMKLQKMNTVIQKGIHQLYHESQHQGIPNTVLVTPMDVDETLSKLNDNLAVLYKKLEGIALEFKTRKVRCKADPFLEQERELFVYFHTNPTKLEHFEFSFKCERRVNSKAKGWVKEKCGIWKKRNDEMRLVLASVSMNVSKSINRKSAVELLAASKADYVKSTCVLDSKQQFMQTAATNNFASDTRFPQSISGHRLNTNTKSDYDLSQQQTADRTSDGTFNSSTYPSFMCSSNKSSNTISNDPMMDVDSSMASDITKNFF